MSNPDSFIQEVSEEVRRDRMFGYYRRYGWIGVVLILGIVGGTGWREYSKSQEAARAQGFGDALMEALDTGDAEARRAALEALNVDGRQQMLRDLIAASDPDENKAATLVALDRVISDKSLPAHWRDLAILRRVLVAGDEMALDARRSALAEIAVPGRPYRALAAEQMAYFLLEEGKTAEAVAALGALVSAEDAPAALKARARQMLTALGQSQAPQAGGLAETTQTQTPIAP